MHPRILCSAILVSSTLLGGGSAVLAQPRITIGPAFTVNEANATTQAQIQISVERPGGTPVRVSYATAPGSAAGGTCGSGGADFGTTTGTLTVPAGQPAGTFSIPICGNIVFEPSETFQIRLSNPQNATLGSSVSVVTIADDDPATPGATTGTSGLPSSLGRPSPPPDPTMTGEGPIERTLRIAPFVFSNEVRTALFPVILTGPITAPMTVAVAYTTSPGTAIGGASCQPGNRDFVSRSGTLTFTAGGPAAQNIDVFICGGDGNDPDETFTVRLTSATNALIVTDTSTATID